MSRVTVYHAEEALVLEVESGAPLAPILREAGLLTQPCGVGKCGKCRIYANTTPCDEEQRLLCEAAVAEGLRLACYTVAVEGLVVTIPLDGSMRVLTSFTPGAYELEPLVALHPLDMPPPELADQRDDLRRCLEACGCTAHALTLEQLAGLPAFVRNEGERFGLVGHETLLGVTCQSRHVGLVADIGTTTLAVLLIDLTTGRVLANTGERNAQSPWGADVISRIRRCEEGEGAALREAVVGQIDRLCAALLRETGLADVHCVVLTGNSTMLHLACGLPPGNMGKAPFIPAVLAGLRLSAREFGLHSQAPLFVMPGISAYVGADITAALLAAEAHRPQAPFLLLDLGTNAEIVLGVEGRFLACSAAAGPCFEGATLSCGMAGEPGAIDTVRGSLVEPMFTTIGGIPPKGLCGSGVLDALALLLDSGVLDETGKLESDVKVETGRLESDAKVETGRLESDVKVKTGRLESDVKVKTGRLESDAKDETGKLASDAKVETGGLETLSSVPSIAQDSEGRTYFALTGTVRLTQQDIREIQLAKAAVRAGMDILLREAGLEVADIARLYLAGGFGAALNPRSAARIGLVPEELMERVTCLGNAAGYGALRYATERHATTHAHEIIRRTRYVELSAHPDFSEAYVERMLFPE